MAYQLRETKLDAPTRRHQSRCKFRNHAVSSTTTSPHPIIATVQLNIQDGTVVVSCNRLLTGTTKTFLSTST
jgi:hypothetical protein